MCRKTKTICRIGRENHNRLLGALAVIWVKPECHLVLLTTAHILAGQGCIKATDTPNSLALLRGGTITMHYLPYRATHNLTCFSPHANSSVEHPKNQRSARLGRTKTSPNADLLGGSGLGVVSRWGAFVKKKIIKPIINVILFTKIHIPYYRARQ